MLEYNHPSIKDLISLLAKNRQLTLKIQVTPKSQRNQVLAIEIDNTGQINMRLKIRGIPEKGEVNHNLIVFLAKELQIAPTECRITGGLKSRHKTVHIQSHAL